MTAGFLAIAADRHITPAAATISAVIEKEPLAIRSFTPTHDAQLIGRQQIGCRLRYRPQNTIESIVVVQLPFPTVAAVRASKTAVLQRFKSEFVDQSKVGCGSALSLGDGRETAIDRFPQLNPLAEGSVGLAAMLFGIIVQILSLPGRNDPRLYGEGNEIGIGPEMLFSPLEIVTTAKSIGKIEGEMPAREIKFEFRLTSGH